MESRSFVGAISKLPEDCLAHVIGLSSARDACRSSAVSFAFHSAAESDATWSHFLPSDLPHILSRAIDPLPLEQYSKKQLYLRLSDQHMLIDDGKMSFGLDRSSGAKCYMISPRAMSIIWGDTPRYWTWIHHPDSRFPEAAELLNVCWLEIRGKIESKMLSPKTAYSSYLVFKLADNSYGLEFIDMEALITFGQQVSKNIVQLQYNKLKPRPHIPSFWSFWFQGQSTVATASSSQGKNYAQPDEDDTMMLSEIEDCIEEGEDDGKEEEESEEVVEEREEESPPIRRPLLRRDGWFEIEIGEFYNEEGEDGEVAMSLLEVKKLNWKKGLTIQGMEIRPKK